MGEQAVRDFVTAGSFVTFCDMNLRGRDVEKELGSDRCCCFVECDIRDWDAQVRTFEAAKAKSPHNSVDIVIANAGISRVGVDSLWKLDDPSGPPTQPDLKIFETNSRGTLYTFKLAVHYFRQQPDSDDRDRCFMMTGSLNAWIDSPVSSLAVSLCQDADFL